ncbi:hypothetical protein [Aureimonas sp. Leaf427]|uniref:hypothetical protein n=1 Tax=Aureimonas sp. Leaf427 TaxID=1736375 RepID=UPI000709A114|nr:hypothetical protein [Aureimonas sp. Leaf427]KQT65689.1 hypothetical protein ASG62_21825 [Aureimonas sp. Leaf427]
MSVPSPDDEDWRIVDAHQHFQDLEGSSYPWLEPGRPEPLEGDLSPIRRTYRPADYRRDVTSLGIVKAVHIQNGRNPADPLEETRWLGRIDIQPNQSMAPAKWTKPLKWMVRRS